MPYRGEWSRLLPAQGRRSYTLPRPAGIPLHGHRKGPPSPGTVRDPLVPEAPPASLSALMSVPPLPATRRGWSLPATETRRLAQPEKRQGSADRPPPPQGTAGPAGPAGAGGGGHRSRERGRTLLPSPAPPERGELLLKLGLNPSHAGWLFPITRKSG